MRFVQAHPQRYFDARNQRDIATALRVLAPTIRWTDPLAPEPMTDHDAVSAFFGAAPRRGHPSAGVIDQRVPDA